MNRGMWLEVADTVSNHNNTLDIVPHVLEIKLGQTRCKNIDLFDLYLLFQVASNKVVLDCAGIDWNRMVNLSIITYDPLQVQGVINRIGSFFVKMGDFDTLKQFNDILLESTNGSLNINIQELFNVSKLDILSNARYNMLPLKKCFEKGVKFCLNCKESNILYSMVYQLIQHPLRVSNESSTAYLW